jgi:hypothetical protein
VKVTVVLAQTGLDEATMATLTGNKGLTVNEITFELAGFPPGQTALEVITHCMASLLTGI